MFERRVGPFRAARCFLVDEHDDGLVWLWLEDLADLSGSMWSVSDYVDVSRAIGEFRGAWFLNEDQDISWLGRNMEIQELLTSELLANNRENLMSLKDSEYLREGLPGAVYEKALGLRDSLPSLAKAARGLEATLAHNDCHIRNLFVSKAGSSITDVVAVDFARVGVGHVGSYGGTMLASAFNWTDAESDVAIAGADLSYKAWLEGLRSTGLQIKDNVARFGYLFPFLRRTMMVSGILAWVALDSDFPLQRYGGRNDEMPLSIRKRLEFMHPLFDEARVLATQLPG
ncbi:MAG: hypothetical protein O3B95_04985 [Chloroflexi bacterium]|nr:hypothetical protein [Chloroflexota bacterium]